MANTGALDRDDLGLDVDNLVNFVYVATKILTYSTF